MELFNNSIVAERDDYFHWAFHCDSKQEFHNLAYALWCRFLGQELREMCVHCLTPRYA